MTSIRISEFNGVIPRTHPELLGRFSAQDAQNAKLWSGKLKPFKNPLNVQSVAAGIKTIFNLSDNWLLWDTVVNASSSLLPGDKIGRTFFTGSGAPRLTDLSMALIGSDNLLTTDSTEQAVPFKYADKVTIASLGISVGDTLNASVQIQAPDNDMVNGRVTIQYFDVSSAQIAGDHDGSLVQGCAEYEVSILQNSVVPAGTVYITVKSSHGSGTGTSRFCYLTKGAYTAADYPVASVLLGVPAPTRKATTSKVPVKAPITAATINTVSIPDGGSAALDSGGAAIRIDGTFRLKGTSSNSDSGNVTISLLKDGTVVATKDIPASVSGSSTEARDVNVSGKFTIIYGAPHGSHNYSLSVSWDMDLGTGDFTVKTVKGTAYQYGSVTVTVASRGDTTAYAYQDFIADTNGYVFMCLIAGTTAGASPTFNTDPGDTTTDGTVTWVCVGRFEQDDIGTVSGVKGMADLNGGTKILEVNGTAITVKCSTDQTYDEGGILHKNLKLSNEGGDNAEDRAYVYSYVGDVDGVEMEGPPSKPSSLVTVEADRCILLDNFPVTPSGYGILKLRVYRTVTASDGTASYLFVTDIATSDGDTPGPYVDGALDKDLAGTMPTYALVGPDPDAQGMQATPNGVMVCFHANELMPSEPYMPHAYPEEYRQSVDSDIVFAIPFGNSVAIGTTAKPYVVTGKHPLDWSMQRIDIIEPCESAQSAVDMGFGVLYAGPHGICSISANGAEVLTRGLFTRDEWSALEPSSILAAKYQDKYVFFYDNGTTQAGYMFDPTEPLETLMPIDLAVTALWTDPSTGDLYLVVADEIVKWDADATKMTYSWQSADWVMPQPVNLACAKVRAKDYTSITFKLYADGVLKLTYAVPSGQPFWLPAGYMADVYSILLTGTSEVEEVIVAESLPELQQGTSQALEAQRVVG